jgi:F1F0 ATPase subunit 2
VIWDVTVGAIVGVVAGFVFFGGLRWTLSRLETARRPAVLVISSLMIRMAVVAGALVVFSDGRLARVLAGLGGLLVVRSILVSATRRELATMEATSWT